MRGSAQTTKAETLAFYRQKLGVPPRVLARRGL